VVKSKNIFLFLSSPSKPKFNFCQVIVLTVCISMHATPKGELKLFSSCFTFTKRRTTNEQNTGNIIPDVIPDVNIIPDVIDV